MTRQKFKRESCYTVEDMEPMEHSAYTDMMMLAATKERRPRDMLSIPAPADTVSCQDLHRMTRYAYC